MSWLNPVAFAGLLALAVPILVHLFGRRIARRQLFPSLRLLRHAQPTPATRSRPSDVLLLVLRCAVLVAAVAALAQPLWSGDRSDSGKPIRAIVVDTSASMQRLTSEGATALARARSHALALRDSSRQAIIVETAEPSRSIAGAASWLSRRGGLREVVVISDFQAGSLEEGHLAAIPLAIGTRLVRAGGRGLVTSNDSIKGLSLTADGTSAAWTTSGGDSSGVTVLAADEDRDAVRRSILAVRALTSVASAPHNVSVVFPGAPDRRELLSQAAPLDSAWQGDLLLAIARDPVLASVAKPASVDSSCATSGTAIAHNWKGQLVASIARVAQGVSVFTCVQPATLAATALHAAVESALSVPLPTQELEPNFLPDETLRRWERPAIESAPHGPEETSPDGRWLWALALGFLVAEEWLRRRSPRSASHRRDEVRRERVA